MQRQSIWRVLLVAFFGFGLCSAMDLSTQKEPEPQEGTEASSVPGLKTFAQLFSSDAPPELTLHILRLAFRHPPTFLSFIQVNHHLHILGQDVYDAFHATHFKDLKKRIFNKRFVSWLTIHNTPEFNRDTPCEEKVSILLKNAQYVTSSLSPTHYKSTKLTDPVLQALIFGFQCIRPLHTFFYAIGLSMSYGEVHFMGEAKILVKILSMYHVVHPLHRIPFPLLERAWKEVTEELVKWTKEEAARVAAQNASEQV